MTERAAALAKLAFTAHPYTYDTRALQAHLGPQKISSTRLAMQRYCKIGLRFRG
jgi:hypothetical protein